MELLKRVGPLLLGFFLAVPTAFAAEWESAESTFVVLTKKAGLASAFAHDHVVQAKSFDLTVFPPQEQQTGAGALSLPRQVLLTTKTKDLVVDDPVLGKQLFPRLKALGVTKEPFSELSRSDREGVAESMFSEEQLWAEKFPDISVSADGFVAQPGRLGSLESSHVASFTFRIRGKEVKKQMPLIITQSGGWVTVEGLTSAKFEEFGFEAYSAMLGAVRNQDTFHFYFSAKGKWKAE